MTRAARAALIAAAAAAAIALAWLVLFPREGAPSRAGSPVAGPSSPSGPQRRAPPAPPAAAPAPAAPSAGTALAAASPAAATPPAAPSSAPPPDAPWLEPPPPLRAVEGLVRNAATGAPVAGAWVTWKLPPPALCERLLSDPDLAAGPEFNMISDEKGRFHLDRLPGEKSAPQSNAVFAVARGYAYGAAVVGLRREVVIDLDPAGVLEVELPGEPRLPAPRLQISAPRDAGTGGAAASAPDATAGGSYERLVLSGLPTWEEDGGARFRISFLRPGLYALTLDGEPAGAATVPPGGTAVVRLARPPIERLEGAVTGPDGPLADVAVDLVDEDGVPAHELRTDAAGRFQAELPRGRYSAYLSNDDDGSKRRLSGTVGGGSSGALSLADRGVEVRITLRLEGVDKVDGIVGTDSPFPDFIRLRTDDTGAHVGRAPPGRYALFADTVVLAYLRIPEDRLASLDLAMLRFSIAWRVPDALGDAEVLRGRVALVPAFMVPGTFLRQDFIRGASVTFQARRGGPALPLPAVAPGAYVLVGETDVGPFETPITIPAGGGEVVVPIAGE